MDSGLNVVATQIFQFDPGFPVILAADLDGNRTVDLFTRRRADGVVRIWYANNQGFVSKLLLRRMSKYWEPIAVDSSDSSFKRIYWRSVFDNRILVWWRALRGDVPDRRSLDVYTFEGPTDRWLAGAKDVDGNGYLDLIWRRDDGAVSVWLGQPNHTFVNRYVGVRDTSWQLFQGGL